MLTPQQPPPAGLYIHVPFCTSVCPYCDFAVTIAGVERRAAWADGVVREASMHAASGHDFDTVYLGGGTPSSLSIGRLSEVLAGIRRELAIRGDARLHIEVNPEDVTPENIAGWLDLGVRFVSLGVQSLNDAELRFLGRRHTAVEAETTARMLVEAGFETVSIDLIYGIAGQRSAALRAQLERAVALGIQHLSCYQLTFHEGTVFGRRLHEHMVSELPAEEEAELFFLTHEVLSDLGLAAYEVSNFAAGSSHQSAHNRKYWDHSPYLGIGPSAHSWVGGRRWWNRRKLRLWQREVDSGRTPIEGHERPTPNQLALEALMLGLRTTGGVDVERVHGLTGVDLLAANLTTLERLVAAGLVVVDGPVIRPTLEGMAVADTLARSFATRLTRHNQARLRKIGQMGKYVPDPEIDRLVQETNLLAVGDGAPPGPDRGPQRSGLDDGRLRVVDTGERLAGLLRGMAALGASDLVLVAGSPPIVRVDGRLRRLEQEAMGVSTVEDLFFQHMGERSRHLLGETGAADFSLTADGDDGGGLRLRVNIQRLGGRLAAAVRALPQRIPTLEALNLPPEMSDLVLASNGLVLVCGPTGSGKSTTLAALLDHLNRTSFRHVITIEEPVEYRHTNQQSVFEQVEVGSDSPSFAAALRSALRRDPDVILVGEMRDLETMSTAITAAETGHLILSTLHTGDAAQAVHRIVDVFPAEQQRQVSQQLALSLSAIVCQQLLPSAKGDCRVPAVEVLLATYAVRNHIRRGNLERLYNELIGGRGRGMVSMERSLADLVRAGRVSADEARMRSSRPDELERTLAGG